MRPFKITSTFNVYEIFRFSKILKILVLFEFVQRRKLMLI